MSLASILARGYRSLREDGARPTARKAVARLTRRPEAAPSRAPSGAPETLAELTSFLGLVPDPLYRDSQAGKREGIRASLAGCAPADHCSALRGLPLARRMRPKALHGLAGGRLQEVYNSKLGMPYIEATNRLSIQEVLALCGSDGVADRDPGPCSMGVDQGNDLHVVIGRKGAQKPGKIIHLGVYKDWDELDRLMKNFNVFRCVVDALPETRNARAFALRHKDRVFLNYYQEHQKGQYAWNEKDLIVSCNRTESLDASHNEIMAGQVELPKECEITRVFAVHLHNIAKRLEEDGETGSKRYLYVKLGPDHFRHAFNYECMARAVFAKAVIPDAFTL